MGFRDKLKKVFKSGGDDENSNPELIKLQSIKDRLTNECRGLDYYIMDAEKNGEAISSEKIYALRSEAKMELESINKRISRFQDELTGYSKEIVLKPIADKQARNFSYIEGLINSGAKEIVLDCDIVRDEGDRGMISIEAGDVVIDGNGHSIDARYLSGFFYVGFKSNVTIKNLTLKNGNGITVNGKLTVIDCIISNNGTGAIFVSDGGILQIKDSILSGNSTSGSRGGGAIHGGEYSSLTVENCNFIANNSHGDGGAIFGDNFCYVSIRGSSFFNNNSKRHGGAVYKFFNDPFDIRDSKFKNNSSECDGGAVVNFMSRLDIINSDFSNNHAKGNGGAIENQGDLNIRKSSFVKSSAADGGAIFHERGNLIITDCPEISENISDGSIIHNSDEMSIYSSNFIKNHSKSVIFNAGKTKAAIFGGKFLENKVSESVIDNDGRSCTLERTVFRGNVSNPGSRNIVNRSRITFIDPKMEDADKAILNRGHMTLKGMQEDFVPEIENEGEIEEYSIEIPHAVKFDFGYLDRMIHESGVKRIVLSQNICLEDYEEYFYEGGIELDIDGLVIDGDGKSIDGAGVSRIFLVTGNNVTIKNITFKNGKSHKDYNNLYNGNGGFLRVNSNVKLTVENCRFINGESEVDGGAIFNKDAFIDIINSAFSSNTAENGGAIYNSKMGKLNIIKSTFSQNIADSNGGAIYNFNPKIKSYGSIIPDSCYLNVRGSTFSDNAAKGGGAIYNHEATMDIAQSTFISNSRSAISCLGSDSKISVADSVFSKNDSGKGDGGAIYLLSVKKESRYLKNNRFEDNKPNDIGEGSGSYLFF